MLVVHDFYLVYLIASRSKTRHLWPAGTTKDGYLADPKMRPGAHHMVYQSAPHGSHGNRNEPPLVEVFVTRVAPVFPYELDDEDMPPYGFARLVDMELWWDNWRAGEVKKTWAELQDEPFWSCEFTATKATAFFAERFEKWSKKHKGGRGRGQEP